MKTIFTGIIATTFAISVNAQVQGNQNNQNQNGNQSGQVMQSQSGNNNATSRAGMDDYSWDPVYNQHMSGYERDMNSDYGILMGQMTLTDDQKNQLKKISDNSRMQMMEMYRNTDLTSAQVRQQHTALLADRRKQISGVLTADQRKQYDAWYNQNPSKVADMSWRNQWAADNMSIDRMRTQLSLTDDQFSKLQKLDAGYTERRNTIMNNASLSADERSAQMKSLMTEKRTAYQALLNADQVEKLKVERDGDVKIKTKQGGETKKIKTKTTGNNGGATGSGTGSNSGSMNSSSGSASGSGTSNAPLNSTGNQNMKSTTNPNGSQGSGTIPDRSTDRGAGNGTGTGTGSGSGNNGSGSGTNNGTGSGSGTNSGSGTSGSGTSGSRTSGSTTSPQ